MKFYRLQLTALLAASTLVAVATSANAESLEARVEAASKKLAAACGADVKKFCGQVSMGEGRLVLCMMAHEDKLDSKCDVALYEASRNLERALDRVEQAADACWPDIEKHCTETAPGGGRVAQCLTAKKASLSQSCQTVVSKFPVKN